MRKPFLSHGDGVSGSFFINIKKNVIDIYYQKEYSIHELAKGNKQI